jgi:hypothetical protein
MADRVGRHLVHGQDHLPRPVIRQPRLARQGQHFHAQDVQRAGVERQVEERRGIAPSRFAEKVVS